MALQISACAPTAQSHTGNQRNKTSNPSATKLCTQEYAPVCAEVKIQCITAPCKPIKKTFSNRCVMDNNPKATFLHNGLCE